MPEDNFKPEDKSDIKAAELPAHGFVSTIPDYLLEGKSEAETYVLKEVSKMSQFIEWAAPVILDSNHQSRRTNGRLKAVEAWKEMFNSWWGFVGAILSVIGGIAGLVAVIEFAMKLVAK